MQEQEWTTLALQALCENDPALKCSQVAALWQACLEHAPQALSQSWAPAQPGRPERPLLVHPNAVPRRRLGSVQGRAALVHAVAHIEFNAINLALDAALRFAGMPAAYYFDWLSVAADEARHFQLLKQRLDQLATVYGDLPAHNGLWEMAEATAHDPLLRMALVPRVLEARGLDVTPGMIERLLAVGDEETVAALRIILREEEGHVAIGSRWFQYLCAQRGLEPQATFLALLREHYRGQIAGPFNYAARLRGGFSAAEMEQLSALDARQARTAEEA